MSLNCINSKIRFFKNEKDFLKLPPNGYINQYYTNNNFNSKALTVPNENEEESENRKDKIILQLTNKVKYLESKVVLLEKILKQKETYTNSEKPATHNFLFRNNSAKTLLHSPKTKMKFIKMSIDKQKRELSSKKEKKIKVRNVFIKTINPILSNENSSTSPTYTDINTNCFTDKKETNENNLKAQYKSRCIPHLPKNIRIISDPQKNGKSNSSYAKQLSSIKNRTYKLLSLLIK